MVENNASVIKKAIYNFSGDYTGSRVTAVLLNRCILPFGGASEVEGLLSSGPTPSN